MEGRWCGTPVQRACIFSSKTLVLRHEVSRQKLKGMSFQRCDQDPCLYFKQESPSKIYLIGVYVDDLIIACSNRELRKTFIDTLNPFPTLFGLARRGICEAPARPKRRPVWPSPAPPKGSL